MPLGRPMWPNTQNEDGTETSAAITREFGYIPLNLSFGGPGLVLSHLRHSLCHSHCAAPLLGKLQNTDIMSDVLRDAYKGMKVLRLNHHPGAHQGPPTFAGLALLRALATLVTTAKCSPGTWAVQSFLPQPRSRQRPGTAPSEEQGQ